MAYTVIWSDAAVASLEDACSHVARHNPQAAHQLGRGIPDLEHVRLLASFSVQTVEILHVWHGAREEPTL